MIILSIVAALVDNAFSLMSFLACIAWVLSTTHSQQSPEWPVLGNVDCFGQCELARLEIV